MNRIHLAGCNPVPLASYLKALGVSRLIGEQADRLSAGFWQEKHFCLQTSLTMDEVIDFFLKDYQPTPILAPWNGGSGFFPKDNKQGIELLRTTGSDRFKPLQATIQWASNLLNNLGITERPDNKEKNLFIQQVRAAAPEEFLPWLDAAITLSAEDIFFPPLLGTGGNDGRLDFTNNFIQRLTEIFDAQTGNPNPLAKQWMLHALLGEPTPSLASKPIGQFAPGNIGGANSTTGFSSDSLMNPWDYILMLEGSLLFASAITRKNDASAKGRLSYPFTVKMSGSGSGSVALGDEKKTRGEIWLPLWESPACIYDIKQLFSEGRATVGRRPARDGLDFSLALAQLGIDRGIKAFERYSFLERNGLAYIASPIGRHAVSRNQSTNLVVNLNKNGFIDRLRSAARGKDASSALVRASGNLENSLFDLTRPGSGRQAIQRTVIRLGEVMRILATSRKSRSSIAVMPDLSAQWLERADDGSHEFRIAAALCSLGPFPLTAVHNLFPVKYEGRRLFWEPESRSAVWGAGAMLERNLAAMAWRRIIDADHAELKEKPFSGHLGVAMKDLEAFIAGRTNNRKIEALLHGLVWARLPKKLAAPAETSASGAVPAAYNILKPFFTSDAALRRVQIIAEDSRLPFPKELISLLKAGNIDRALEIAWRRLRAAGMQIPSHPATPPAGPAIEGSKLLAALLIPISFKNLAALLPEKIPSENNTAIA
ncbi:MAG: type I-U CRISPR-associated protein Csx17 [Desulfosalsimonas sp.]